MGQKLKIGIIGIGTIADVHAQAINASDNMELLSAYSRNKENVLRFSKKYNIQGFTDWNKFINDQELDVVSICTPNGTHLDYGEKAAEAKKHVIVEKPIEVTLERAQKLINACKKNDVQLAIIYQSRFMDNMQELKDLLDNNGLGKLFMGDAYIKWYRSQAYYDSGAWRGTIELDGGGVLINQAIHTVDLLQWLMGDVDTIYGQTGTFTHNLECEDNAVATLRYKNGAIGVIQASTSVQPSQSRKIEIHGEKGSVLIDGDKVTISLAGELSKKENSTTKELSGAGSSSPMDGFSFDAHQRQFDAIANAIRNNEIPPVSGEESLRSLAIVLGIYESARTNTKIHLLNPKNNL